MRGVVILQEMRGLILAERSLGSLNSRVPCHTVKRGKTDKKVTFFFISNLI